MTPQQKKADELVKRFWVYAAANKNGSWFFWKNAIQCAIICVERLRLGEVGELYPQKPIRITNVQ